MVEQSSHFKAGRKQKESQWSLQGYRWHPKSVYLLLDHINEMYSDIKQGEHKSTDQLDQCIKDLVERCQ